MLLLIVFVPAAVVITVRGGPDDGLSTPPPAYLGTTATGACEIVAHPRILLDPSPTVLWHNDLRGPPDPDAPPGAAPAVDPVIQGVAAP